MTRVEEMQAVLAAADCIHDAAAVDAAYDRLAEQLQAHYAELNPLILVVMMGGFIVAAELLKRVQFPFDLDYLHATRYRGDTRGGALHWKRRPEVELSGRHVLVIDDILDEGQTLRAIRSALLAREPASLQMAVLTEKRHDRRAADAHAEYVGLDLPDRYVFGCGMDYQNYWRQLPAIYAVQGL